MLHQIKVSFDTETGKVDVDTGDTPTIQAMGILNTARKFMRKQEGLLEVLVSKDTKTQIVTIDFQADEILQWSELLGMLHQAVEDGKFKQRFQMTMLAQQNAMQQAQNAMQNQAIAAQIKGKGKLVL